MSVVIDSQTEAQKSEYDREFTTGSVVDTSGELQAAKDDVDDCWFCSYCSVTL